MSNKKEKILITIFISICLLVLTTLAHDFIKQRLRSIKFVRDFKDRIELFWVSGGEDTEDIKVDSSQEFVAHAGGGINGLTYTNSREALDSNYDKGFRYFEIDFNWTADHQLVLLHDWGKVLKRPNNSKIRKYTLGQFMTMTNGDNLHQMSLEDIMEWLDKHEDAYIITDVKENNVGALKKIRKEFPDLIHRTIPQIYRFREYDKTLGLGYKKIILTLYRNTYSDEILIDFLNRFKIFAITMPKSRASTGFPKKLSQMGIFSYVHTINTMEEREYFRKKGINGFYTDFLIPH